MAASVKNLQLYTDAGYVNAKGVLDTPFSFIWCVGPRGTGKTFSFLDEVRQRLQPGEKFLLLRRTQSQVDSLVMPGFSPFDSINRLRGTTIEPFPEGKSLHGYYSTYVDEDGKTKPEGPCLGYIGALTTFANVRGLDAFAIKYIIFDEFIKEKHQPTIRGEAEALINLLETINRNRELEGYPPVRLFALGNSMSLANPYFIYLNWVTTFERMIAQDIEVKAYPKRDTLLLNLTHSPISAKKADTALYRMTDGTGYADMALHNRFGVKVDEFKSLDLKPFKPLFTVGEITVYQHKSERWLYISPHRSGSVPRFDATEQGIVRFKRRYGKFLLDAYIRGRVQFETYYCEALMLSYIKGIF